MVIGAGVVGAACAYYAALAGLSVAVVDRGPVAGGTTGAGEGNLLVSDKEPGPELELALLSTRLWCELAVTLGEQAEYEPKGGLVVASGEAGMDALRAFAARQGAAGVESAEIAGDRLHELEPHLAPGLAGGFHYPQDAQVQPALAAAHLLRAARAAGAVLYLGEAVTAVSTGADGAVRAVVTDRRRIDAPAVVNAAGTWGGEVAGLAGVTLPVLPRRGFVLVTEPLPRIVRHKVCLLYTERVGFDRTLSVEVLRRLAAQAAALFPVLAEVSVQRAYRGFRPYLPDHLPAIGADPRVPGLHHACGHEGAGIGLAPATGLLISRQLTGKQPELDLTPFRADRFEAS